MKALHIKSGTRGYRYYDLHNRSEVKLFSQQLRGVFRTRHSFHGVYVPYKLFSQVWELPVRLFRQNTMHVAFWQTAVTVCGFRATRNIAKYPP
ncbi:hypothetical protein ABMA09_22970 [Erwinia rhapontici]